MENDEKVTITVGVSDIAKQVLAGMQGEGKKFKTITDFRKARETADFLNIDPSTLARWEKSGYLIPVRIGGRKMYRVEDIEAILNGEKKNPKNLQK